MSAVATLPKRPPRAGERLPASFGLSLAMHLLLFAALAFVVRWNVEPQGMVVAELWGVPASVEPQPAPLAPPVAVPEPKPAPTAELKPAPVKPEADIALEQEKKRRAAEAAAEQSRRAAEKKRQAEEADRKKAAADKERQAAAEREQRDIAAIRKQQQERILAQAGGSGAPGPEARGARGSGDTAYEGAVKACILPHIVFAVPDTVKHGQHKAEFVVSLLPSREQIGSPRLVKPSGLPGFDSAVERAIRRCDPFPPKKDGSRMEREITVVFDPVDAR